MPKRKRGKEEERSKDDVKKFKGVKKSGERFRVQIIIDGKRQYPGGTYDTAKEAAQAYDRAAIQAGRSTSKLNFLDQVPKSYKPKNNGLHSTNTSGFRGVSKNGNRFQAKISIGGDIQQNIGSFGTAKEAAIAWDLAAIAWDSNLMLNFPEMNHAKKKNTKKIQKIQKKKKQIKKKKTQVPIIQIKKKRKIGKTSTTKSKNYSIKTASREFPI